MNLQCKKARIPIAALGVTALCTAGIGFLPSAVAAGTLTLNPGVTSINTVDIGSQLTGATLVAPLANATFGISVAGTATVPTSGYKLVFDSFTAPSGITVPGGTTPTLSYSTTAAGLSTGPTAGWAGLTKTTPGTSDISANVQTSGSTTDELTFVTANFPGSYTAHFVDPGTAAGTDDDSVSPTLTINVKDAVAVTAAVSDDFTPAITVPANVGIGAPVQATVSLSDATLTDARGSSSGAGVLGAGLNALTGIAFTGTVTGLTGAETTATAGTFGTSSTTRSVPAGRITGVGTVTTTVSFNKNGDGTLGDTPLTTASTSVASNGVTSVGSLAATDVTGSVKTTGGNAVAAKPSQTAITYSATVANTTLATDVADKTVYFTVGSATPATLAKISSDGTTVDTSTTAKVFSAKTDSTGKATIKVTAAGAASGDVYTVTASSNGQAATSPATLTTTYANAQATSVKVTSTTSDLTVSAGNAVTVKGTIYDQFGAAVTPSSSASQQAQLYVGTVGTTCTTPPAAPVATNAAGVQNATVTGGTFSFSYTPTTPPTAGQCVAFRIGYDANGDASISTTESDTGTVNYASAADAAALSITAPIEGATPTVQTRAAIGAGTPITGVVTDATSATVAYKSVKLTGGDGIYFSTVANPTVADTSDDLVKELTVVTNGSGAYTAYAFFTDSGDHKITVASGATATKSVNVTVSQPLATAGYTVSVDDVVGSPGDTLIVTGKVADMFGNPVPNANVDLETEATTVGSLGSPFVSTNAQGIWSTTFTSGSNSKGEVKLTATLTGQTANLTPGVDWKAKGGLTFADGVYKDTASITVANADLTLTGPAKATASANGAKFNIKGTFLPTTSVDIYGKVSGSSVYQLMGTKQTDEDGKYVFEVIPKKSTTFLAKSIGLSSGALEVTVFSKVSLTAKALGGGKVKLTANGDPNVKGPLKFYRSVAGADPRVGSMTSSAGGVGSVTVKVAKGTRKFYATFDASGTNMGTSKVVTVKVK